MQTPPTPRLTAAEISALLSVAGDANARETLLLDSGEPDEAAVAAFERGMEKLRVMLARRPK